MANRWSAWVVAGTLAAVAPGWAQNKPAPPAVNPKLPKDVQAAQLVRQAEDLQDMGKLADAAKLFQQAADLTPEDWTAWDRAGWGHLDASQAAAALKAFETARKTAPPGTPVPGGLVVSHYALGNKKEVLDLVKLLVVPETAAELTQAVNAGLAAKPFTLDWNFALGSLYARVVRNSERALAPLEAVVKANPKHAAAWLLLVEVNQDLSRGAQEDAAAVQYLTLAPDTPDAFRLKAERHAALQQYQAAIQEYEAGITKHPKAAELYLQVARVYERTGGQKQAENAYRRLITAATENKLDSVLTLARFQLANYQARHRSYIEAEKYYREAAQKPDATAATTENWGSLLALTGKWEEAAKALETAAERSRTPDTAGRMVSADEVLTVRYHAAVCRLAAGQRDLAKAGLEAAVAGKSAGRTGAEGEAQAFLAWIGGKTSAGDPLAYQKGDERWASFVWREPLPEGELEARGRFSIAATAWRAILQELQKKQTNCWPADFALARIYASGGFTDEALGLLNKSASGKPNWWAPHFVLGQYYARQRDREKGSEALRTALKLAPDCRQAKVYLSLLNNARPDSDDDNLEQ